MHPTGHLNLQLHQRTVDPILHESFYVETPHRVHWIFTPKNLETTSGVNPLAFEAYAQEATDAFVSWYKSDSSAFALHQIGGGRSLTQSSGKLYVKPEAKLPLTEQIIALHAGELLTSTPLSLQIGYTIKDPASFTPFGNIQNADAARIIAKFEDFLSNHLPGHSQWEMSRHVFTDTSEEAHWIRAHYEHQHIAPTPQSVRTSRTITPTL